MYPKLILDLNRFFSSLIQSTFIFYKNNIKYPLSLYSVSSNDERIIPSLLIYEVIPDNKNSIIKITFDPNKTNIYKVY